MARSGGLVAAARVIFEISRGDLKRDLQLAEGDVRRSSQRMGRDMGDFTRGVAVGTGAVRGLARAVAFASGAFLGGAGLTYALRRSVEIASDLEEQTNKVNVVFRAGAGSVLAWSKNAATGMGLAQVEALRFAGTFGSLLVPMGILPQRAAAISTSMVKLAGDMASFNNASVEDVLLAQQSAFAGEIEPMRKYGVFLDQSRIKAEALRLGLVRAAGDQDRIALATQRVTIAQARYQQVLAKYGPDSLQAAQASASLKSSQMALDKAVGGTVPNLTAAQKALATYSIIMRDTRLQQGDFARTSGGLANQTRILKAQLTDLQAELGKALLPTITSLVKRLNEWLEQNRRNGNLTRWLNSIVRETGEVVADVRDVIVALLPILRGLAGATKTAVDAVGGLENALKLALGVWVLNRLTRMRGGFTGLAGTPGGNVGMYGAAGAAGLLHTRLLKLVGRVWTVTIVSEILGETTGFNPVRDTFNAGARAGKAFNKFVTENDPTGLQGWINEQFASVGREKPKKTPFLQKVDFWLSNPRARFKTVGDDIQVVGPDGTVWHTFKGGSPMPPFVEFRSRMTGRQQQRAAKTFVEYLRRLEELPDDGPKQTPKPPKTTGGSGGKPDPKGPTRIRPAGAPADPTELPARFSLAEAAAQRTRKNEMDDIAVWRSEIAFLRRVLQEKKLTLEQRADILGQIADLEEKAADAAERAADGRKEAEEEATRVRRERLRDTISDREDKLKLAYEQAQLTEKSTADDGKALLALRRFYMRQIRDLRLTDQERRGFQRELIDVRKSIAQLGKKGAAEGEPSFAEQRAAFLQQWQSTLGEFGSNIRSGGAGGLEMGSRPINITQNFHAEKSEWEAMRDARLAAAHQLT